MASIHAKKFRLEEMMKEGYYRAVLLDEESSTKEVKYLKEVPSSEMTKEGNWFIPSATQLYAYDIGWYTGEPFVKMIEMKKEEYLKLISDIFRIVGGSEEQRRAIQEDVEGEEDDTWSITCAFGVSNEVNDIENGERTSSLYVDIAGCHGVSAELVTESFDDARMVVELLERKSVNLFLKLVELSI